MMKKMLYPALALILILGSCTKKPVACFTAPDTALENQPIEFENCSVNATRYYWWFDDGDTSVEENPVKSFSDRGIHLVYLTAYAKEESDVVQRKANKQIVIGNLFLDSLVINNYLLDNNGNPWDSDGSQPDLQVIYGSKASNVSLISREYPDFDPADLPIIVVPIKDVKLTDTVWHFQLVDRDLNGADTIQTWQVDPVEYGKESPFVLNDGNKQMELHFSFK